tara:strand:- start:9 stop:350 length:342 start_codon:yes stop_codon:yes gene_type:complete
MYHNKLLFVYDGKIYICNKINHKPFFYHPYDRIAYSYIKMPYFDDKHSFHEKNVNFNEYYFNKTVQEYQKQFFEVKSRPPTPIITFDARYENPFIFKSKKTFINSFFQFFCRK